MDNDCIIHTRIEKSRFTVMAENKATVARDYVPKHSELFDQCSKLAVKTIGEKKKLSDDIFTFQLFEVLIIIN